MRFANLLSILFADCVAHFLCVCANLPSLGEFECERLEARKSESIRGVLCSILHNSQRLQRPQDQSRKGVGSVALI